MFQDSLYKRFLHAAKIRYETQATNYLELTTAETRSMEIDNALMINESDIKVLQQQLRLLLNDTAGHTYRPERLDKHALQGIYDSTRLADNPLLVLARQDIAIAEAEKKIRAAKAAPDFKIGYFNQSMIGSQLAGGEIASAGNRFQGFVAGITIPLFFGSYVAETNAAKLKMTVAQTKADYYREVIYTHYRKQLLEVLKYQGSVEYYESTALKQADRIIETAQKSFENGAISYIEYYQNITQALNLKFDYLNTMNEYNQSIIKLEFLIGN